VSADEQWLPSCSLAALRERGALLAQLRQFFADRNVLEVQTSCLGRYTVTDPHVDAIAVPGLGYLQTSPEYQLKRLLAAGAGSLYQIGPAFRAGESGRLHNPEFTMLEWYRLGYDDTALMAELALLVDEVLGPADYHYATYAEVVAAAESPGADRDLAYADGLRALQSVRLFVTDFPPEQAALARLRGSPPVAARFELVIAGVEIANGYYELGDVQQLTERFSLDLAQRRERGAAEPRMDPAFLAAMDAGLPECAGVAIGVDRLLMLKLGAKSLAEVMPFPIDRA
jgi:lysyl-tRNA synthetase class 2